jgi:hypothetical protein
MIPPSILKPFVLIPLLSISSSAFLESVRTGSETGKASYSVGKAGPCFRVKQPERVAAHSSLSVVEFKKTGVILLLPTYAFIPCAGTNLPLLFIHCIVRFATGPYFLLKRSLQKVWSSASSFKFHYLLYQTKSSLGLGKWAWSKLQNGGSTGPILAFAQQLFPAHQQ